MKKVLSLIIGLLIIGAIPVFAHSGKTDANGGHNVSGGGYHYHHGYPAHQHTDGICPYNYDDKTNHNGGSRTDSDVYDCGKADCNIGVSHTHSSTTTTNSTKYKSKEKTSDTNFTGLIIVGIAFSPLLFSCLYGLIVRLKEIFKK